MSHIHTVWPHPSLIPLAFISACPVWDPSVPAPVLTFDAFLVMMFYPVLAVAPVEEHLYLYYSLASLYYSQCPPGAALAYVAPATRAAAASSAAYGAATASAAHPAAEASLPAASQNQRSPDNTQSTFLSGHARMVGNMGRVAVVVHLRMVV